MKKGREEGGMVKNGVEMVVVEGFGGWEMWKR